MYVLDICDLAAEPVRLISGGGVVLGCVACLMRRGGVVPLTWCCIWRPPEEITEGGGLRCFGKNIFFSLQNIWTFNDQTQVWRLLKGNAILRMVTFDSFIEVKRVGGYMLLYVKYNDHRRLFTFTFIF